MKSRFSCLLWVARVLFGGLSATFAVRFLTSVVFADGSIVNELFAVLRSVAVGFGRGGLFGADETFGAVADEVLASRLGQCLAHKRRVLRAIILQKGALKLFFVIVGGDVHLFHIEGIDACIVHDGGRGSRGGVKVLHLFGGVVIAFEA